MSQLNWSELIKEAASSTTSYEPLPDGDYELKVLEAAVATTSTGKTMFKVKSEVQSGPHARRFLWDNLVISPENSTAMGIFFSKMGALGLGADFFAQNPANEQIAQAMNGRTFRGTVGSRPYNGEIRNEFKRYLPAQANVPTTPVAPASAPAPAPAPAPAAAAPAAAPVAPVAPPVAPSAPVGEVAPPAPPF